MQIKREVAQQALDAIQIASLRCIGEQESCTVIAANKALQKALDQPEPEPDAWWWRVGWRLSPTRSGAGVVNRLAGQENERALYLALPAPKSPEGWKEATIAWEVCASVHRQWAIKKDALFTTRQADFVRHAEHARKMFFAAAPEYEETLK